MTTMTMTTMAVMMITTITTTLGRALRNQILPSLTELDHIPHSLPRTESLRMSAFSQHFESGRLSSDQINLTKTDTTNPESGNQCQDTDRGEDWHLRERTRLDSEESPQLIITKTNTIVREITTKNNKRDSFSYQSLGFGA
jgi:hypothetical protein